MIKNLIVIVALFFTYQLSQAQGNLQFNKVINMQIQTTGASNDPGNLEEIGNFTVPDGKIWKVTVNGTKINGAYLTDNILCKGTNDSIYYDVYNGGNFSTGGDLFEFFYSSGTYGLFMIYWTASTVKIANINGIEYNIIAE